MNFESEQTSASVGSEGGRRSPGRNWMKSLKTAAVFQTSSSSLPSITGGLSKRVMRTGFTFSGVRSAALVGSDAGELAAGLAFVAGGFAVVEVVAGGFVAVEFVAPSVEAGVPGAVAGGGGGGEGAPGPPALPGGTL